LNSYRARDLFKERSDFYNEASSNSMQAVMFIDGILDRKVTQDRKFHFPLCQSCEHQLPQDYAGVNLEKILHL
jgi:hypothetical protein